MKLITAVIKPIRLESLCSALEKAGFSGVTATEVQGRGAQGGRTEYYRGQEFSVMFRTKIRLELLVSESDLERALEIILSTAKTGENGEIGDGKVWVSSLEQIIRVRTGETGESAI
ncbi:MULTISPECIES: P-II family nitrogen regulator [Micrococcaceae]|uniref:P-II family nitrogen regulator n=1 Tax=Glutamicibacter ectropisis TaxID=3046593 RepID=A0AAU6WEU9_9MICC|nr:P-II family nitrogen regulator [Arthrobacter sp. NIO-1057]KSU65496.1 transcriptional regulator [Arthrobacter sp. NIO-1057]SCC36771.1 nitrogen regulatory protein P-II family [Arthrobacter sp. NIO-1057]